MDPRIGGNWDWKIFMYRWVNNSKLLNSKEKTFSVQPKWVQDLNTKTLCL